MEPYLPYEASQFLKEAHLSQFRDLTSVYFSAKITNSGTNILIYILEK